MKKKDFELAAVINDKISKLEKTINQMEEASRCSAFEIKCISSDIVIPTDLNCENNNIISTKLSTNEISTSIFIAVLEYYIGLLNLELNELKKEFDNI